MPNITLEIDERQTWGGYDEEGFAIYHTHYDFYLLMVRSHEEKFGVDGQEVGAELLFYGTEEACKAELELRQGQDLDPWNLPPGWVYRGDLWV